MKDMKDSSVDMVITDPPYGIEYQSNWGRDGEKLKKVENDNNIDEWLQEFSDESYRVMKDNTTLYCFTRFDAYPLMYNALIKSGYKIKNLLVVQKGQKGGNGYLQAQYSNDCELLVYASKGRRKFNKTQLAKTDGRKGSAEYRTRLPNVWFDTNHNSYPKSTVNVSNQKDDLVHPTEKNVELVEWLIKIHSNEGELILDPFIGSGTTAVACVSTGRKYIGMDIDEEYVELTNKRISEYLSKIETA